MFQGSERHVLHPPSQCAKPSLPRGTSSPPHVHKFPTTRTQIPHPAEQNFFSGTEIYFKATKIYFQGTEIYFQALEITFPHAKQDLSSCRKQLVSLSTTNYTNCTNLISFKEQRIKRIARTCEVKTNHGLNGLNGFPMRTRHEGVANSCNSRNSWLNKSTSIRLIRSIRG